MSSLLRDYSILVHYFIKTDSSVAIKYSMRDLICDVNDCAICEAAIWVINRDVSAPILHRTALASYEIHSQTNF